MAISPGDKFMRRKKERGSHMGRVLGWTTDSEYQKTLAVNEDVKEPSE